MRRLTATLALLALCATLALAQRPEESTPRFEPVEIISAEDLYYPPMSVAFGTVVLQVTVSANGAIEDVKTVRDIKSLTSEAVKCLKKWKFKPAQLNGKPVRASIAVAFTFSNPYHPRL